MGTAAGTSSVGCGDAAAWPQAPVPVPISWLRLAYHTVKSELLQSAAHRPGNHVTRRAAHGTPVLFPPHSDKRNLLLCAHVPQIYLLVLTLRVILTWFRNINWYNEPFATLRQVRPTNYSRVVAFT